MYVDIYKHKHIGYPAHLINARDYFNFPIHFTAQAAMLASAT